MELSELKFNMSYLGYKQIKNKIKKIAFLYDPRLLNGQIPRLRGKNIFDNLRFLFENLFSYFLLV